MKSGVWSSDTPTVSGYYWVSTRRGWGAKIVTLEHERDGGLRIVGVDGREGPTDPAGYADFLGGAIWMRVTIPVEPEWWIRD